jgi:isoquinoline 1-oxidoreductase subunit alpha
MQLTINVNGRDRDVDVDDDTPLLWVLRDELKLRATKYGCGASQCGACTVHVDGIPVRSCGMAVGHIGKKKVTTFEGLDDPIGAALVKAWVTHEVPQCGFCQPGQIMSAVKLLDRVKTPTDRDIDLAMTGNICRCGTYARIRKAIKTAALDLGGAQ